MSSSTPTPTPAGALADLAARLQQCAGALLIKDASRLHRQLHKARAGAFDGARFARELEAAQARAGARTALLPAQVPYPEALPVVQARPRLLEAMQRHAVLIVCGETGSGKSTQLPKLLLEAGCGRRGLIGHTQPRRLAARKLAARVAQELQSPLGGLVGYETRFDKRVSPQSLIKLMTDGILLAELAHDRWLENYEAIIVDEAHERTLNIDFLLGRLRQIQQRRPDLKLIITSATLDPERLSRHFGDAPILTVEGRTYPVEQRYREAGPDEELEEQVTAAVDALWRGGKAADTLIFLPGEREINELVRVLGGRYPHAQALPLYTRLPAAQQDRVFAAGGPPKLICTTNVAETSVTVPGIRYVIDTGTARVNRFAPRLGVQHLEIEPISQAAANQRAGRCGRVGPGICVRLYSEQDYLGRPLFTDPEIRRVNLANVLLQMAALNLGDIEAFPWIDAPDGRHIADGLRVLHTLGALEELPDGGRRITALGRELARLPLDPRVARIALAGRQTAFADEVYVLAAALSIQDPHDMPPDAQDAARQKHAEWRDARSDFLSLLNLWQRWRLWNRTSSKRGLRRVCEQHYVSYTRLQEWDALYAQIRDLMSAPRESTRAAAEAAASSAAGVAADTAANPANDTVTALPDAAYPILHKALLAGLIDHLGQKRPEPEKKPSKPGKAGGKPIIEYLGPRGRRFRIFPGSTLAKKTPDWLISAQLVQTTQLYARTNAAVEPPWLAEVGAHLVKRNLSHPHWNAKRGEVTAVEQVSLLGLPLLQRPVHYGSHDAAGARAIFIRDALVRGQMPHPPEFVAHNLQLADDIRDKEARLRRPDLLADEEQLCAYYDTRLPADICTTATLKRWLREPRHARAVHMQEADALRPGANADVASQFPDHWLHGELRLRLSYRHDPGSAADGLSVHIPLAQLHGLRHEPFDWLVPGLRAALFEGLIRTLPNDKRRRCTPAAAWAQALCESLSPADGALLPAICARFRAMNGIELQPEDFAPSALDAHLHPRYLVEDEHGTVLAESASLQQLQSRLRGSAREALRSAAVAQPQQGANWERGAVDDWDFGDLPEFIELPNGARATPALCVEHGQPALRLFESREAAWRAQREGQRALLLLKLSDRVRDLRKAAKNKFGMSLIGTALSPEQLADELLAHLADGLLGAAILRHQAQFAAALARRAEFSQQAYKRLDELAEWLAQASLLRRKLATEAARWADSAADLQQQLASLFAPGFISALPPECWPRVAVWLRAAALRLERLANKPQRDAELLRQLSPLSAALPHPFHTARWLLEEWRVQLFAQDLRAVGAPTAEKIRAAMRG